MVDQPSPALVKDLKARGLLEMTVVHWGREMGLSNRLRRPALLSVSADGAELQGQLFAAKLP